MNITARLYELMRTTPEFTMFEIGACDGYHTNMFVEMLRSFNKPFTYHAFEPVPNNFAICKQRNVHHKDLIRIWPFAIGAETGDKPFHISSGQKKDANGNVIDNYYGSSSLRTPKLVTTAWPDMTFTDTVVSVLSLDDFTYDRLIDKIDFIWADVQGAQCDLIRGGVSTMKRVRYLYVEYDNTEMYEGEEVGVEAVTRLLPDFEVVEDYGGDVLLHNKELE